MSGLSLEQRLAQRGLLGAVEKLARKHHVTMGEVLGRQRFRHIVAARHAAWRELRAKGLSYPAIAWLWGVDHTTVLAACTKAVAEEVQ
jgi:chromosomal replication initiation ATPase DnaA